MNSWYRSILHALGHHRLRRCAEFHTEIAVGLLALLLTARAGVADESAGLAVRNGWFVHGDRVVWGYAQHNGWWRPGQRPNLTRNAPGEIRPNRTEDLEKLTSAMLQFGYPGFEHNFGLWYDRRRDQHDVQRRLDPRVVSPFLEQPWARSGRGSAWDGLSKYDLTRFNDWYFDRLSQFAELCDEKGTVLLFNFYMQHALLETNAHYVDFPWRPTNCIQQTGMPDRTPAANAFYDVSHPVRRELHTAYIHKCLDKLSLYRNVVFLCGQEYTGPIEFMQFWLDTVSRWEKDSGKKVHVALSGCKNVVDQILADHERRTRISTIDLRYWWYEPDGHPFAPKGGQEVAGRYIGEISRTTAPQIYRQVKEYRLAHPQKAIIHGLAGTRSHAWAALMGGASLMVGQLPYPNKADPAEYMSPELCQEIQPTYDFIRRELARDLVRFRPRDQLLQDSSDAWCLADDDHSLLIYSLTGEPFRLDLTEAAETLAARWFNPRTGVLTDPQPIPTGQLTSFTPPDKSDWALWLREATGRLAD